MKKTLTANEVVGALGYGRASTLELAAGHTLDTQEHHIRAWAEREGWQLKEWYQDGGYSGRHAENRPALQAMLARVAEGGIKYVLVRRRDRLARNLADVAFIERELKKHGAMVLSLDEPGTNDPTPSGFLSKGLQDLLAAHYSIELSHKTKAGWRTRAEKGLLANAPFGYRQVGDPRTEPPTVVPDEAAAVRLAFERYATGAVSMVAIAEELNEAGHRTRYRARRGSDEVDGRRWTSQSVSAMLANPAYLGRVTHHGEELPGRHEAIVDEALFRQVQRLRGSSRGRPATSDLDAYLLRGIARCSHCGYALQGNRTRSRGSHRYYRETSRRRGVECDAPQVSVRADWLEGEVDRIVARFTMPEDVRERVLSLLHDDAGGEDTEAALRRLNERLRRLNRLFADLQVTEGEYEAQRRALEAERDRLTVPTTQATDAIEALDVLQAAWARATPQEKRGLALALFEAIFVNVGEKRITEVVVQPAFRPWISNWQLDG